MRTDSTSSYIFAIALSFADLAGKGFSASTFTNYDKTASYQYSTWCEKQVENSFVSIFLLILCLLSSTLLCCQRKTQRKNNRRPLSSSEHAILFQSPVSVLFFSQRPIPVIPTRQKHQPMQDHHHHPTPHAASPSLLPLPRPNRPREPSLLPTQHHIKKIT